MLSAPPTSHYHLFSKDVPLLFQHDNDASMKTADTRLLAREMLGYWTRFAAYGDPNSGVEADSSETPTRWPMSGKEGYILYLRGAGANTTVKSAWQEHACDHFWREHWDDIGRCKSTPLGPPTPLPTPSPTPFSKFSPFGEGRVIGIASAAVSLVAATVGLIRNRKRAKMARGTQTQALLR